MKLDLYEEAAQEAEKNNTSVKEEMKYIDEDLAREHKFLFGDEEDEIQSIIKQGREKMNDDVISYIINEIDALHIYPINDKQYAIALKEITPQIIHCLHSCGCYNIQIAGIWKEWATNNVCMEYIEISCEWTKGE